MTLNEFMENLSGMNDGGNFPRDILKPIFNSIKNEKLVWAQDQPADNPKVGGTFVCTGLLIFVRLDLL